MLTGITMQTGIDADQNKQANRWAQNTGRDNCVDRHRTLAGITVWTGTEHWHRMLRIPETPMVLTHLIAMTSGDYTVELLFFSSSIKNIFFNFLKLCCWPIGFLCCSKLYFNHISL